MIVASKGFASFIDFKDKPPKRCLDIGTGVRPLTALSHRMLL